MVCILDTGAVVGSPTAPNVTSHVTFGVDRSASLKHSSLLFAEKAENLERSGVIETGAASPVDGPKSCPLGGGKELAVLVSMSTSFVSDLSRDNGWF